jgi:hypothetical protein
MLTLGLDAINVFRHDDDVDGDKRGNDDTCRKNDDCMESSDSDSSASDEIIRVLPLTFCAATCLVADIDSTLLLLYGHES